MAAASLPRPGVQVIQQFRAQSPTIITPQLVPCIIGVCKQIVELLQDDGAGGQILNPDALIQLPAFFTSKNAVGSPPVFTGLDGLRLSVSINNAPAVQVTFSDPSASGLTPATVASQINTAFTQLRVSSARALVLDAGTGVADTQFKLQTVGLGQYQSIYIDPVLTDDVVADAFGIGAGQTYSGLSDYNNLQVVIPQASFPDPRGNLSELNFELDTIRVFLSTGSGVGIFEASRTESFLRNGVVNEPAVLTSTLGTITYPSSFYGRTLALIIDGETQTYVFPSVGFAPADGDEVAAMLSAGFTGLTVTHDTGVLTYTTDSEGNDARIQVVNTSTALALLGLVGTEDVRGTSIMAVDDGNGDATTSLIEFDGEDFTLAATQGVMTGATAPNFSELAAGMTLIISDGQQAQTVIFTGSETTVTGPTNSLEASIEAIVGTAVGGRIQVTEGGSGQLVLTNTPLFGDESLIKIIGGTALTALDEGTDPAVTREGSQTLNPNTAAIATEGTVSLVAAQAAAAATTTFSVDVDGALSPQTIDAGDTSVDHTDVTTFLAYLQGQLTGATVSQGPGGGLLITSNTTGASSQLTIADGSSGLAFFGLVAQTVNGVTNFPTLGTETFQVDIDESGTPVTVSLASETSFATLKTNLEAQLSGVTVTQGADNGGLVMTGTTTGRAGTIRFIDDGGGALALLGLVEGIWYGGGEVIFAGAEARGRVHPPLPGDDLYIDGQFYSTINQVAPGGNANQLKIDRQVVIDNTVGARWFIQAKDLAGPNTVARPSADLQVTLSGEALVKHSLMRDFAGDTVDTRAPLYLTYTAVRLDTTPLAEDPGLLRFDDTTQLENALSPISSANPLALGIFFALVNAPGVQITGLGVDGVTADAPDGTVEAFTRAAEYLEGFEVYALAPLTHDESVAQIFNTHVNFMSEPEQRGERVVMWNPNVPTNALDTLVGSGTNGDALNTFTFDTKIVTPYVNTYI